MISVSTRLCRGCTGYLFTYDGRWVHIDGGGPIWHRCDCGWSGSDASRVAWLRRTTPACPACGSSSLRADHVGVPEVAA